MWRRFWRRIATRFAIALLNEARNLPLCIDGAVVVHLAQRTRLPVTVVRLILEKAYPAIIDGLVEHFNAQVDSKGDS